MDNRRKQIVINKKFQQQYAIIIVAMTVFLVNISIIFQALFPGEQPFELSTTSAWSIGLVELVLVIGVWYGSLRSTLKIAGPVYVITRQLKAVGAGDLWARISLRQGDMFQEEAAAINASLDQLQARVDAAQKAAELVRHAQAEGRDTADHVEQLISEMAALRTVREE